MWVSQEELEAIRDPYFTVHQCAWGTRKRAMLSRNLTVEEGCTLWYGLPWKLQWHIPHLLLSARAYFESPFAQEQPMVVTTVQFRLNVRWFEIKNSLRTVLWRTVIQAYCQVFPIGLRRQIAHTESSHNTEIWFMDTLGPSKWNDTNLLSGCFSDDESVPAAHLQYLMEKLLIVLKVLTVKC